MALDVRSDFLPAPHMVFVAAYKMAVSGILVADTTASLFAIFSGFLLASVIAVPLGILVYPGRDI